MKLLLPALLFSLFFHCSFSQSNFCLTPAQYSPLSGNYASGIAMCYADFNTDGYNDIAFTSVSTNGIRFFLSNGPGGLQAMSLFTTNSSYPWFVTSGDLNGDLKPDLVYLSDSEDDITVLLGLGNGSFTTAQSFSVGFVPSFIVIEDLNGDGFSDLVVSRHSSNLITIMPGNGTGIVTAGPVYNVGTEPYKILCNDFNNDGKKDLATIHAASITFLKNNGNGNFTLNNTFAFNPCSFYGYNNVIASDVNLDNKVDLISLDTNGIVVTKGNGNFSFLVSVNYPVNNPLQYWTRGLALGDFNNDGKPDIITANLNTQGYAEATIFPNTGASFGNPITFTVSQNLNGVYPLSVLTVDVNHDNRDDFMIGMDNTAEMPLYLNCNTVDVGLKQEQLTNSDLTIFPNPTHLVLTVSLNTEITIASDIISIYNPTGEKIKNYQSSWNNGILKINTTELPNGIYYLSFVTVDSGVISKRFIISH